MGLILFAAIALVFTSVLSSHSTTQIALANCGHQRCKNRFQARPITGKTDHVQARQAETLRTLTGLRVNLTHRDAHPLHRLTSIKDSLSHSLRRDVARSHSIDRRVGNAAVRASVKTTEQETDSQFRSRNSLEEELHKYLEFEGTVESGASLGSGEYFMDIFIGTPPHRIPVIIDTGSDLTWVQCDPCDQCYLQEGPVFQPRNSKSYIHIACIEPQCALVNPSHNTSTCSMKGCSYFYWYGDFSNTTGDFAMETFTMNKSTKDETMKIENVMFGCGHNNEGMFQGAGGLLGLGQGNVSFASQVGSLFGNKFSYCLVDRDNPLTVSSTIVFGDDNILTSLQDVQFTPFVRNPVLDTFYYVNISHLVVGGEVLVIPETTWEIRHDGAGGTIIDSGTTLTYFSQAAYQTLWVTFAAKITLPRASPTAPLHLCYNISGIVRLSLPTFSVVFKNGAVWHLPSENVFIQPDPDEEILCLAILGSRQSAVSIIGNYQQQNFQMIFDRANSQLGFASRQCSSI